jgi:MSHA biogenesis protein MshL
MLLKSLLLKSLFLKSRVTAICLLLGLSGCESFSKKDRDTGAGGSSNAAQMQTLDAIDLALDDFATPGAVATAESVTAPRQAVAAPPDEVLDALLPELDGGKADRIHEGLFDISVRNIPTREFFMGLVKGSRYNMAVHPDVQGMITLDLNKVSVPQVVDLVVELYGLDYKELNGVYQIFPGGLKTQIYPINYLNIKRKGASDIVVSSGQLSGLESGSGGSSGALDSGSASSGSSTVSGNVLSRITTETESDFWASLQNVIAGMVGSGKDTLVVTDRSAGLVIVRASPAALRTVETYLRRSELILQRQVVLEARVLEVILKEGFEQGINWTYFDSYTSAVDAAGAATKSLTLGQASQQVINNELGGVFSASLKINDFSAFIQLLGTQGTVQVLSSPRIATINNQKAVIKVGSDEFFVTGIETSEDTTGSNENLISNVELTPFFSGIALDVTPQISEGGNITLHVHPTVSEVVDQIKTVSLGSGDLVLPLAYSTVRETDSIITARNGQVVVIGGLIQNVEKKSQAETPLLADLPYIGEMFRQHRNESVKSELVILLRPTLSNDLLPEKEAEALRERFNSYRQLGSGF